LQDLLAQGFVFRTRIGDNDGAAGPAGTFALAAQTAERLVILGFPADDVVGQEPRTDDEIAEFCRANFGVSFPMFAKSNVVDDPVNPLFVSLGEELGEPSYNFNKYLIDRRGRPVERFDAPVEPDSPELTEAIEQQLRR